MNENWIRIFKTWTKAYANILYLEGQGIVEEDDAEHMRVVLLQKILEVCDSEIKTASENCQKMSEIWIGIFKIWIKTYESIQYLEGQGIVEKYYAEQMRVVLLQKILEVCDSEINEQKK